MIFECPIATETNLELWREEYLRLRREIFSYDEDFDVFEGLRMNSKDLKYQGVIRRAQIEFNEDNFNRDLERNELLVQTDIIKREANSLIQRMRENHRNPRLLHHYKSEAQKLLVKQKEFKRYHGQNFGYMDEEKDKLNHFFLSFDIEAFRDSRHHKNEQEDDNPSKRRYILRQKIDELNESDLRKEKQTPKKYKTIQEKEKEGEDGYQSDNSSSNQSVTNSHPVLQSKQIPFQKHQSDYKTAGEQTPYYHSLEAKKREDHESLKWKEVQNSQGVRSLRRLSEVARQDDQLLVKKLAPLQLNEKEQDYESMLNKISNMEEDKKDSEQIRECVNRLDSMIQGIGGVNCGWNQEDHRRFLHMYKKYGTSKAFRWDEAMMDDSIAVLQFYSEKELLKHLQIYTQLQQLNEQKQKFVEEYKLIKARMEKRRQAELELIKHLRNDRKILSLKNMIRSTESSSQLYIDKFQEIKNRYKLIENRSTVQYQKRQQDRQQEISKALQQKQSQQLLKQIDKVRQSQENLFQKNVSDAHKENKFFQIPRDPQTKITPANSELKELNQAEKITQIQNNIIDKLYQIEQLRIESKSKKLTNVFFTPQAKKKTVLFYRPYI